MLKTMYPPQANSPLTTLAGALTQSATEIMVLAGVVLPDAPNLLVIGGETEQAETVLMTAKDGNTLTLVRAVQGVAREWPAGSTIARFFTAKDLADIQDNIKTIAENYIPATEKGAENGVATLDANGKLTDTQKPGYTASEVGAAAATHASQHASGGSDPITPADIGAQDAETAINTSNIGSQHVFSATVANAQCNEATAYPATSYLRESYLRSVENTPSTNGVICWQYE